MIEKLHGNSTKCPHCGANLIGHEIPEKDRHHFGGATHFNRQIGIEYDNDCVEAWECPDCHTRDGR
jgi:predicted RNA-binding Zn-ribbon protein involved in translation (DUF1610 family)